MKVQVINFIQAGKLTGEGIILLHTGGYIEFNLFNKLNKLRLVKQRGYELPLEEHISEQLEEYLDDKDYSIMPLRQQEDFTLSLRQLLNLGVIPTPSTIEGIRD